MTEPPGKSRFLPIDLMRGWVIAAMILVNTPGNWGFVYAPMRHANWHGLTPTDLVFPMFLWIIGFSMALTLPKVHRPISVNFYRKSLKRVLVLFGLGLFLNVFPFHQDFENWRIMGVLQRIALCYGLALLPCLFLSPKKLWIMCGLVLLGYWGLLVSAGGSDPYALETCLVTSIDRLVLGESHLWHGHQWQGHQVAFDPEGLLSTFPATVSVLVGFLQGQLYFKKGLKNLVLMAIAFLALGYLWSMVMPINKALWTSSYTCVSAGYASLFLALLIWIHDKRGIEFGTSFPKAFGMNALFSYVLSIFYVLVQIYWVRWTNQQGSQNGYDWLFNRIFQPVFGSMNGSLFFAVFHVLLFWALAYILYRKRIFIKL